MGFVHFIQLNSEQMLGTTSKQRAWLEQQFKAIDRSVTPWVIVGMHRPLLVDSNDKSDQAVATLLRKSLEPLFAKYEVDVVLAGHIHAAQRSCIGVLKGTCVGVNAQGTALGPTHVLTGQGGYQSPLNAFKTPPSWEAWASWGFGFNEMLVTRTTLRINALGIDGTQLDTFTLSKPQGWTPNLVAAAARYAATASWVVPQTVDIVALTASLVANFVTQSIGDDQWPRPT